MSFVTFFSGILSRKLYFLVAVALIFLKHLTHELQHLFKLVESGFCSLSFLRKSVFSSMEVRWERYIRLVVFMNTWLPAKA